ncbi:repeat element protein-d11.4 [Ichnoviriform fugitivi]|uniref:Repeat element protein-d11.4 n=1 Tax=Ichnoviriform fugitivi TaxID=265522 RepID=A2Q0N1_9VIRU|nr:repeat element protein-d11.4 [Ichnoviriform fugitivi]BAF45746.1 repeat element protein-d11.4 [Ichnoviriform fugitivi]
MHQERCATLMKDNGERSSIGAQLSQTLSTGSVKATFFNGRQLEIHYTFDPSRKMGDRVLIQNDCLLPLLSGYVLPGVNKFTSIQTIIRLTTLHVHLDMCLDGVQASCRCHLISDFGDRYEHFSPPSSDECGYGHFHHFCSGHLASWFEHYLNMIVLFQESRQHFDEEIADMFLALDRSDRVYFHTGERPISEFLLRHALELY